METELADWSAWSGDDDYRFYYRQEVLPDEQAALKFQLDFLRRTGRPFDRALEYGCGPTLHRALVVSPYVRSLDMADRLESNLAVVRRWLQRDPASPDRSHFTRSIL